MNFQSSFLALHVEGLSNLNPCLKDVTLPSINYQLNVNQMFRPAWPTNSVEEELTSKMKDPHGAIIHVAALSEECPEMEAGKLTQKGRKTSKVPMDACCPDQNHQRMEDCTKIYAMQGCQK